MSAKLYNEDEKEEFLQTLNKESTQIIYKHMFTKSRGAETLYEKDLYDFSLAQIEDVMRNINPATPSSTLNSKSRMRNYIAWAIRNGRRNNNTNPLSATDEEWELSFVGKGSQRYLSEENLNLIVDNLYNAQDQALVQCLFEGIMGKALSELISIRYSNINWMKKTVTVYDSKTKQARDVKVGDRCLGFLEKAYNQNIYDSESERESTWYDGAKLIKYEDFVFKKTKWGRSKGGVINENNLRKRLHDIKEKYELDEFMALSIHESGRIKMAADIAKDKGYLTKEDFNLIGDKFNLTKMKQGEYEYHNVWVMKQYINSKTLKELYDIDIVVN